MELMIRKILKIISTKTFYILIGIFLSLSIFTVQAAWNSKVSSGQTLAGSLWNDMVDKLTDLDNKTTRLDVDVVRRTASVSAWRWPSVTAVCLFDEMVVGGGGSCTSSAGYNFILRSEPSGNGWRIDCDTPLGQTVTATSMVTYLKR